MQQSQKLATVESWPGRHALFGSPLNVATLAIRLAARSVDIPEPSRAATSRVVIAPTGQLTKEELQRPYALGDGVVDARRWMPPAVHM